MKKTVDETTDQIHARSLLTAILGAPANALPRRAVIVDWLNAYLVRASQAEYVAGDSDATDLTAVDRLLRLYKVPVAEPAAL